MPSAEKLSRPKPGLRRVVGGDEEDGFGDAAADGLVLLVVAPPAQRGQHRVVERGTAIEVADLQEDVVKHQHPGSYTRGPRQVVRSGADQPERGVQRKKRIASTRPATPQSATTARLSQEIAEPPAAGT